jgi:phosphatidylglycerophosphate synthase
MTTVARIPGLICSETDRLTPWLTRHAAIMLAAIGLTLALPSGTWLALAGAWSFAELWYRERERHARLEPYGGYANQLTALRAGLLLAAAALLTKLPVAWLWALLLANVAIDVADGHVARRTGQVTPFGAVFDREVDALFVLIVYAYLFLVSGLRAWVLIPGALPYLFRFVVALQRDRPPPELRERWAPVLAGVNFVVLLAAVASPPELRLYVAITSVALVGVSFLVSFAKLFRHDYSAS